MEENIYLANLFCIYSSLFTEMQKNYFKLYYFENLTMEEIAENYNVSKTAVSKSINTTIKKLNDLEKNLKNYKNNQKLEELLKSNDINYIKKEIEEIIN